MLRAWREWMGETKKIYKRIYFYFHILGNIFLSQLFFFQELETLVPFQEEKSGVIPLNPTTQKKLISTHVSQ